MEDTDIWYLQDEVDGKPLWGIFETGLLRKQILNGIVLGLHHEKIVDQIKGQGGYAAALLMNNNLFMFAHQYRIYLVGKNKVWTNDPEQEIDVIPNPTSGTLILADGDLEITTTDCAKIYADNKGRKILCVDEKTLSFKIPGEELAETYFTHDNGGRPFQVDIADTIKVYKQKEDSEGELDQYEETPLFTFEPLKVFIGKSPLNKMTEFSGGHGPGFDGNSILLKLKDGQYVYIGESIQQFTPKAEIVEYVSPVGNNDVPYPYAIDAKGNHYLLIEDVIVQGIPKGKDPYDWYYDRSLITPDLGMIPPKQPVLKAYMGIKEWYVGDEQYTMRYTPIPAANYNRLTSEGEKMYLVDTNGSKMELSKEGYIQLMKDYGKEMQFRRLKTITLQKRLW